MGHAHALQFPYLTACIDESLRVSAPGAFGTVRLNREDTTLCGFHIPKGTYFNVRVTTLLPLSFRACPWITWPLCALQPHCSVEHVCSCGWGYCVHVWLQECLFLWSQVSLL